MMHLSAEVAPGQTGTTLMQGYNNADTWQGNVSYLEEPHSTDAYLQVVAGDPGVPSGHQQAPPVFPYNFGVSQVDRVELPSMPASMVYVDGVWRDPASTSTCHYPGENNTTFSPEKPPTPVQAPIQGFGGQAWEACVFLPRQGSYFF